MIDSPRGWRFLEKYLGWIAIPNIAILLVTLQGLGFLMVAMDPIWVVRLALIPEAVFAGQYWRLITFLALPLPQGGIWVILALWFLYSILNSLEQEWGSFKTTFYTLVSVLVTIVYSLCFHYPVMQVAHFQSTLFLAAAALFPEMEILFMFILPVKMKWLAWVSLAYVGYELAMGDWFDRFFLISIYSNYLLFFGPAYLSQIKHAIRRYRYKRQLRD